MVRAITWRAVHTRTNRDHGLAFLIAISNIQKLLDRRPTLSVKEQIGLSHSVWSKKGDRFAYPGGMFEKWPYGKQLETSGRIRLIPLFHTLCTRARTRHRTHVDFQIRPGRVAAEFFKRVPSSQRGQTMRWNHGARDASSRVTNTLPYRELLSNGQRCIARIYIWHCENNLIYWMINWWIRGGCASMWHAKRRNRRYILYFIFCDTEKWKIAFLCTWIVMYIIKHKLQY